MSAISDIEAIQRILASEFPEVEPDGDVGKITTAALKALKDEAKIEAIQKILQPYTDEELSPPIVGPRTLHALKVLDEKGDIEELDRIRPLGDVHTVKASSFADPADVRAFRACKQRGGTDQQCFAKGDNGIGAWGAFTAQEDEPMAALPREVWRDAGKRGGAPLEVTYRGVAIKGVLGDTMPALANIRNGAGIDLNPAFSNKLGLRPPFLVDGVTWRWL